MLYLYMEKEKKKKPNLLNSMVSEPSRVEVRRTGSRQTSEKDKMGDVQVSENQLSDLILASTVNFTQCYVRNLKLDLKSALATGAHKKPAFRLIQRVGPTPHMHAFTFCRTFSLFVSFLWRNLLQQKNCKSRWIMRFVVCVLGP